MTSNQLRTPASNLVSTDKSAGLSFGVAGLICLVLAGCGGGSSVDSTAQAQATEALGQASSQSVDATQAEAADAELVDDNGAGTSAPNSATNSSQRMSIEAAASGAADPSGDAGPPPGTKPPKVVGTGLVGPVSTAAGDLYFCRDSLITGYDWFARLKGWFPSIIHTSHSVGPTHEVVDMAYSKDGAMTFSNVVAPSAGSYQLTLRYAYASGLFGGITDRPMGVMVNGLVVTDNMHFPITNSFSNYRDSSVSLTLHAGQNEIRIYAVSDHGVSRVDTMLIKKL